MMRTVSRTARWFAPVVVGLFVASGLVGPLLFAGRASGTALDLSLAAPSLAHLLGTDQLGRDELARVVVGAQGSALAVLAVLAACVVVGGVLGLLAGWYGGSVDRLLLRVVDLATVVPTLLVGLVLAALLGGSAFDVALALAITSWPAYVRVIRTEVRLHRRSPHVSSLLLLGARPASVLTRHVAPALLRPVTVLLGLTAAEVVVSVATLSFLGLGAQPPAADWGSMLVDSRPYLSTAPWLFASPAIAVVVVVASCNIIADRSAGWFTRGVRAAVHRTSESRRPDAHASLQHATPADDSAVTTVLDIADLGVEIDGGDGDGDGGQRVVDGVSLRVAAGETLAVVGPSGSGKTMTLQAALGLVPPGVDVHVTGSALVGGVQTVGASDRQLRAVHGRVVGFVPQDTANALNPLRRVGPQVAGIVRLHTGGSRAAARRRAVELLAQVGLSDPAGVARRRPRELSGGMRQRVVLACAVAGGPRLLVADEPTSALDATAAVEVVELLRRLREELHLALVVVTHDLALAATLAESVAVFDAGSIVESGTTATLLAEPRHPITRALVAAATAVPTHRRPAASPADVGPAVLQVRGLHVVHRGRFRAPDVHALRGVDLDLAPGEVLGVVGSSGCGKSTLARAICGLETHPDGEVLLNGRPASDARGRTRLVFQDPTTALDPRQTGTAALREALRIVGTPRSEIDAGVTSLLAAVGLTAAHGGRRPWQLSGGERQRLVIARALVGRPDLLVLDEPVSALDSVHRAGVVATVRDLVDRGGPAVVLIAHDLAVVEQLADRVLVMHDGRVVDELAGGERAGPDSHRATRELTAAWDYFRTDRPADEPALTTGAPR